MPLDVKALEVIVSHTPDQIFSYLNIFTQQVISSSSWNTLPDEVVTANNIGSSSLNRMRVGNQKDMHGYAERLTAYCYLLSSQTAKYRITQCT